MKNTPVLSMKSEKVFSVSTVKSKTISKFSFSVTQGILTSFLVIFIAGICSTTLAQTTQTFTTSGTFVVPAGVTTVQVDAWGGGGAGGGVNGSSGSTRAGGGGSGGTFTRNTSVSVTPGSSITVTVGAGGLGVNQADGGNGGTSTFASGTPVTAVGGGGGKVGTSSPTNGAGGGTATGVTFNGGTGAAASGGNSGGGGGGAGNGPSGNGGNASGTAGGTGGAGTIPGGAGAPGLTSSNNGTDATALSGGGGGGRSTNSTDRTGGDGFRGQVIVAFNCPVYSLTGISGVTPICASSGTSVISLTASATELPVGSYTITYNRSSPAATGLTASMTVSVAGSGSFTATGMTTGGSSTITITNLASGAAAATCNSSITGHNTVITVNAVATAVAGTNISNCSNAGAVNITAGSSATNNAGVTWTSNGTGTFTDANSLTLCTYTPSAADIALGSRTLTLTATGNSPCGNVSSNKTIAFIAIPSSLSVNPASSAFCAGGNETLTGSATTTATVALSAGTDNFNGTVSYVGTGSGSGGTFAVHEVWTKRNSGYNTAFTTFTTPDASSFMLTVNGAIGGTATQNTILTSPVINTNNYTSVTISYQHTYKQGNSAGSGQIQVSTDGGSTWPTTIKTYTSNQGTNSAFVADNVILSNTFLNQTNLKIRFVFACTTTGANSGWWGLDNVALNGVPIPLFSWTADTGPGVNGLPPNAGTPLASNKSIIVLPTATTNYTMLVTDPVTGCTATSSAVPVTLHPSPVLSEVTHVNVNCNGGTDGSMEVLATSGTPPYLFSDGNTFNLDGLFTGLPAGTHTINVTDDNGCEDQIQVVISEPAILTAGAGSNNPVCIGSSLNLTSTPSGGTTAYSYVWDGPDGFSSIVQNPSITAGTLNEGTYTVTVTDAHNCTVSGSVSITINALPTATISGNSSICLGNSFPATLNFTGTGPWSYTISNGIQTITGSASNNPENINIIPSTAGTHGYGVIALSDANCSSGSSTGSASVVVSSAAPANTVSSVGGTLGACNTDLVLMTCNTVNGQNIKYSWNTGSNSSVVKFSTDIGGPFVAGPFQTTTNSVYAEFGGLAAGSSGYNICVQGTNSCGSTNNKCTWVRGIVSPPGAITGSAIVCDNAIGQPYSAASVPSAVIYTWSFPGATITGQGTPNVTIDFPSFSTGQLCVTAALACGGSSTSAPKCMTVSNATANPGALSGPAKICPGQTGVVYSVPSIAGATTYNWTVPSGATITGGSGTSSITVSWPIPYTLNANICVTATSACGAVSSARCKSVMSSIPSQPAYISGQSTGLCGQTVVYSVVNVQGASSYTWVVPAGGTINSGQGTNSISVIWGLITTGQMSVTANSACGNSPARTLNIAGAPATPGIVSQLPAVVCNGGPANFSISAVTGATNYIWTVPANGSTIDNGQGTTAVDVTWGSGAGSVTVKSSNGCGNSATRILIVTPGCKLSSGSVSVTGTEINLGVYPNPAHEKVTVRFNASAKETYSLSITDLAGRVVSVQSYSSTEGVNTLNIDLSTIAKGVYTLEVKSASDNNKIRLIVE